jgi:hypothetical protein
MVKAESGLKMRHVAFAFLTLALVTVAGGAALADSVTVTLTGAGGVISKDRSVYVGPYQLQVGGQTFNALATTILTRFGWGRAGGQTRFL